jgi:hypothetical protein
MHPGWRLRLKRLSELYADAGFLAPHSAACTVGLFVIERKVKGLVQGRDMNL